MKAEKIGVKAALKDVFSKPVMKALILIYLIALAIQLYDNVQNAISSLILSLICFALILGAIRLTRGIKVEAVPVRRPLIGVVASALMLASWFRFLVFRCLFKGRPFYILHLLCRAVD